ncbi:MAG: MotA/TolQ/ExbB proton channel family protein [Kiritimatiellales bacterium]
MFTAVYDKIGPSGAAIAVLAFAAVYLFFYGVIYLLWVPRGYRRFFTALNQPDPVDEKLAARNPLSTVLWTTLSNKPLRAEIQDEVQYLFQRSFSSIYVALTSLRLISVMSPLLGLLGTVLGISRVFHAMSLTAAADNSVLAGGIWEALITTIMGLTVALPTLLAYYLLRLRVRALMIDCIEDIRHLMAKGEASAQTEN